MNSASSLVTRFRVTLSVIGSCPPYISGLFAIIHLYSGGECKLRSAPARAKQLKLNN